MFFSCYILNLIKKSDKLANIPKYHDYINKKVIKDS